MLSWLRRPRERDGGRKGGGPGLMSSSPDLPRLLLFPFSPFLFPKCYREEEEEEEGVKEPSPPSLSTAPPFPLECCQEEEEDGDRDGRRSECVTARRPRADKALIVRRPTVIAFGSVTRETTAARGLVVVTILQPFLIIITIPLITIIMLLLIIIITT